MKKVELTQEQAACVLDALKDILAGWKYIRRSHGDLYGVGWDRAQRKAERAISEMTRVQAVISEGADE